MRIGLPLLKEDEKMAIPFDNLHSGQSGFLQQNVNAAKFIELRPSHETDDGLMLSRVSICSSEQVEQVHSV